MNFFKFKKYILEKLQEHKLKVKNVHAQRLLNKNENKERKKYFLLC